MKPVWNHKALAATVIGLALLFITTNPVSAAPVSWTDATGFWDVAGNWSSNPALPGAGDDVTINVGGTPTVTVRSTGGPFTVNSLRMPGDDILAISGGSLTVTNDFTNAANTNISTGSLTLNGVSSMGSLTQSSGSLAGTNNLTVTGPASLTYGDMRGAGSTILQGTSTISSTLMNAKPPSVNQCPKRDALALP